MSLVLKIGNKHWIIACDKRHNISDAIITADRVQVGDRGLVLDKVRVKRELRLVALDGGRARRLIDVGLFVGLRVGTLVQRVKAGSHQDEALAVGGLEVVRDHVADNLFHIVDPSVE